MTVSLKIFLASLLKSILVTLLTVLVSSKIVLLFLGMPSKLDTNQSALWFGSEPKSIVYGRSLINPHQKNIFFMGASNVREGFNVNEMPQLSEQHIVHNAAVGASNIRQIIGTFKIFEEYPLTEDLHDQTIVVGLWYGIFIADDTRWKQQNFETDIQREQLRYNLYANSSDKNGIGNSLELNVPPFALGPLTNILEAALAINTKLTISKQKWRHELLHVSSGNITTKPVQIDKSKWLDNFNILFSWTYEKYEGPLDFLGQAPRDSVISRTLAYDEWDHYIGEELKSEQFELLSAFTKDVTGRGATVVYVDMPLPEWHQAGSEFYQIYQTKKLSIYGLAKQEPGVVYINLQDQNRPMSFYDSVHPNEITRNKWSYLVDHVLVDKLP